MNPQWSTHADLALAGAVILIVVMMVIPLPTAMLDVLIALNLSVALVIVLLSMYSEKPLDFSIFPSLLLIMTLYRLALNVSSTRLILLQGDAGDVIDQFGRFVVGGSPWVGFIVFVILVVIQYIVITQGAERVAEVAARFTLDAMPGKQMSIDADLNAGVISEETARERRRETEQQADFYGAMDGASKFVKGDAIAGIIITVINIAGGFSIGLLTEGLTFQEALSRYTLLTVGDGLVSQIPALLLSTATGIIVTRGTTELNMGGDTVEQLSAHPRVLWVAAVVLILFALVPGLPALPFMLTGLLLAGSAFAIQRLEPDGGSDQPEPAAEPAEPERPEEVAEWAQVDPIELELGYGLLTLTDDSQNGDLLERIGVIRRQLAMELGLVIPLIRVRDHLKLDPRSYRIMLRGVPVGEGEIDPDRYLALDPGTVDQPVEGRVTEDPTFGLPARWIDADQVPRAETLGYTVVDPAAVIGTHLTETLKAHAHEILTRQEVRTLLDSVREQSPAIVDDLIPDRLELGVIRQVLQNLLKESVSIRDLTTILETLADYAPVTQDPGQLTEYTRQALRRQICHKLVGDSGTLPVIALDPELEAELQEARVDHENGSYLDLSPAAVQQLIDRISQAVGELSGLGEKPVLVTAPHLRRWIRQLAETTVPDLVVLSYEELTPQVEVVTRTVVKAA